jgi:hypothetical protein
MGVSVERAPADQEFVEHDAETEQVASAIDPMPFSFGLFGAHVGRGPSSRKALADFFVAQGQTKVDQVNSLGVIDENVLGFDIPVDDSLFMGQPQGIGQVDHPRDNGVDSRLRGFYDAPQIAARDVSGNDVDRELGSAPNFEDGDDIGMFETSHGSSFFEIQFRVARFLDELRVGDFDCNLALELFIGGEIDDAETTAT